MSGLHRERCQSCTKDTPTISALELPPLLEELHGDWSASDGRLRRRIAFRDFAQAFTLATRIALLSEREGHHPDLKVGWGYLEVELTTHAAGGLTRNDFILAAKVDRAAATSEPAAPTS